MKLARRSLQHEESTSRARVTGCLHSHAFGAYAPQRVKIHLIRSITGKVRRTRAAGVELVLKIRALLDYGGDLVLRQSSVSRWQWLDCLRGLLSRRLACAVALSILALTVLDRNELYLKLLPWLDSTELYESNRRIPHVSHLFWCSTGSLHTLA